MQARWIRGWALCAVMLSMTACDLLRPSGSRATTPSSSLGDSGLPGRCKVAASQDRPLVTEWSASEKAHLESLAASQAVVVSYSGCELRVLDGCKPSGRYAYRRTTLATDTVEIVDSDDLFAKLPIGALKLEGELARSGRLAVRTTVAGQFSLDSSPQLPTGPGCEGATHVVTGISVGAFSLLTGGATAVGGGASVGGVGGGGKTSREESVMRQAGDPKLCTEGDGGGPNIMCASPIQVFLSRVNGAAGGPTSQDQEQALVEQRAKSQGVLLELPAPKERGEVWKLYNNTGKALCVLPCSQWVAPRSGYYLERSPTSDKEGVRIDVPNDFSHPAGSRLRVEYGPDRGWPFLSKLTFYGVGIPAGGLSLGLGIAYLVTDDDRRKSFYLFGSIFYGISAAGTAVWYFYSDDKHFRMKDASVSQWKPTRLGVSPAGLVGSFW